jgi:hypothetical protein
MANLIARSVDTVVDWVNQRAPNMMPAYRKHMTEYYAPKNFNFWYYFGSLAMLVLVNQIVTASSSPCTSPSAGGLRPVETSCATSIGAG